MRFFRKWWIRLKYPKFQKNVQVARKRLMEIERQEARAGDMLDTMKAYASMEDFHAVEEYATSIQSIIDETVQARIDLKPDIADLNRFLEILKAEEFFSED